MLYPERKNPSTKELIIDILSTNIQSTAKKVYYQIKLSKPLTYHAVFKLLNQMVDEGILLKEEMQYSLNPLWIKNMKEYYQALEQSYMNKKEAQLINKDTTDFVLPSLHKGFIMLMRALERGVFGESDIVIGHFSHLLFILLSEDETALLKRMGKQRRFYYLVRHNSNLDKMIAYYNKKTFNYRTKLNVLCAEPFYLYVVGDKIIQINISNDIKEAMDKIYNTKYSTTLFPKPKIEQITTFLNEIARKKTNIYVHVVENKDMAQEIREKTVRYFE